MAGSVRGLGALIQRVRRVLWALAILGLLAPWMAKAAVLAEPDARAVRAVVEAQLGAFAEDDAERAFSYASASVRAQFGDAIRFMAMVRSGYPMVVRPAYVAFFKARAAEGDDARVSQMVHLRDRDGRLWMATYLLERQMSDGWRISGCVVVADDGKSTT